MAKKIEKVLEIHGDKRVDPYFWMNERDSKEVLSYLHEENRLAEKVLKPTQPLQDKLFIEMKSRLKEEDSSVPVLIDHHYYYTRFEQGKEYPIHCRKFKDLEAKEEVILDVNELAQPHDYYSLAGPYLSHDHKVLAFAVDTQGRRFYNIHFKNLESGEILPQVIEDTTGNLAWANDSNTLYYTKQDPETLRSHQVHRYYLKDSQSQLLYTEQDETYHLSLYKSKSKKYVFIHCGSTLTTEIRYITADQTQGEFKVFAPRRRGHEYEVEHGGDRFYILTNDQAKNFRVMETLETETERSHWQETVTHRTDVLIEDIELFENYLVLEERSNGLTQLHIIDRSEPKKETYIEFPDPSYVVNMGHNPMFKTKWLRFHYESLNQPPSVFDFHMDTEERVLKKQKEVPGFNPDHYESHRTFAKAQDGTLIPISLVYKKGLKKDGQNPLLQYGYGSYGMNIEPWFQSNIFSLVDRGFVYAIAHIRGGSVMGRHWYDDGKLLKKMNTFTDFIDCSEHLIKEGYTSPKHLYALGGSAGGLLMGAVINMRPDLYNGVIAAVPFVDVVTTMLDTSIPLTTGEFDEWGNPQQEEYYSYIKSYSPYDNVAVQDYPHLFVKTGYHDSQVQYWEPAKWVAKLKDLKTDNNILILRTDMDAGHTGTTGRFKRLKESAMEYTFFLMLEGLDS